MKHRRLSCFIEPGIKENLGRRIRVFLAKVGKNDVLARADPAVRCQSLSNGITVAS